MQIDFSKTAQDYGLAASLPPEQVARFDLDLQNLLAERFADDPLAVPHRVFAVIARVPERQEDEEQRESLLLNRLIKKNN
jgi:hypothetical protein